MTIYSCIPEWDAMLTCIYEAWAGGKGHHNVRLCPEPIDQYSLFHEYIHVDPDPVKAQKVIDAVCKKISPVFYEELAYSSMAYEEDVLDNIYRMMIMGFAYGEQALHMVQYRVVFRHREIKIRVGREAHYFREFLRFHEVKGSGATSVYVAHFEPKSRVVLTLGPHFTDRMPSEHWMIVDDVHRDAIIHPKNEPFYYRKLTDEEFDRLNVTDQMNDEYTELWKAFFHSIAIEQRENTDLQRNLFPLWMRKHIVEFQ